MRTNFTEEIGESATTPKDSPNNPGDYDDTESERNVNFPRRLRYKDRGRALATIYKRPDCFRLYWRERVDGKASSHFKDFSTYSAAKRLGKKKVEDLAKGKASGLSPGKLSDAKAALEVLRNFFVTTGREVSLLGAASEFAESARKLHDANIKGRSIPTIIDDYLATAATVKPKDLGVAVEDFLTAEEPRTKSANGRRPELSPKYHYTRCIILRRFASTHPNTTVNGLSKKHLDLFMSSLNKVGPKSKNHRPASAAKSRNHYRAAIRQFLAWAVRNDYIATNHRLNEADRMRPENGNTSEILFYTPAEFKALLERASKKPSPPKDGEKQEQDFRHLLPMLAIGGLAGLRTQEILRLTWEDTRRVENHIEVTSGKAKTRQRRLVEVVPSLAQWLAPYAEREGNIWVGHEVTFQQHFVDLCAATVAVVKGKEVPVMRKPNGLRHSFCTYHFAAHGNENLTAQQAGNSPTMLHRNYKGLAIRKEGESWFAVAPTRPGNVIAFVQNPAVDQTV